MATQVLPSDDTFDRGGDVYNANVCMYVGCRPASTTANAPVAWAIRLLHSGYQTIGSDGVNSSPAAMLGATESVSNRIRPGAMLYRGIPSAGDIAVSATFRQLATIGNPNYALIAPTGVMARVQGGTLNGSGELAVRIDDPSCYIAYYRGRTSIQAVEFVLARVTAGAFAILAYTSKAQAQFSSSDLGKAVAVSLTCTTVSTDVSLAASFTGLGMSAPVALAATDTGGGQITTPGRCGFSCGRDRQTAPGTIQAVDLVEQFSIVSGATVLLDDRFQRVGLAGAYDYATDATYSDTQGNDGRSLQMAYYWDQFTGGDETVRLVQASGADTATWAGNAGDSNGMNCCVASRPASNVRSQRRSISITMPAQPTSGQQGAGIVLRASQPAPVAGFFYFGIGYLAWIYWSAGGTTTPSFAVTRHRVVGGTPIINILATYADAGDAYTNGYAAAFILDFEVYNRVGSTSNGPTILKLRTDIGGGDLQVPLVASSVPGITVDTDGTLTDASSNRISQGVGEGFALSNSQGNTATIVIDDWLQGVLTNADLADRDQASVVVATEGTLTGVDLSTIIGVDYGMQVERQHYSIVQRFESGHSRGNPRFTNSAGAGIPRSLYTCQVRGVTATTLSAFLAYWDAHAGIVSAFPWTPPGEDAAISGHFLEDSLRYDLEHVGTYALAFRVEEIL